jgi:hypothetical protein
MSKSIDLLATFTNSSEHPESSDMKQHQDHDLGPATEKGIQHRCRNLCSLWGCCKGNCLYRRSGGH